MKQKKIRKKGDKDSYLEAYLKYREGLENGFSCDDLFNHMQIWKKICIRLFCKKYIDSGDEDELEEFIQEYEPNEIKRINDLKSHLSARADKIDNDNISKEDKKKIIQDSLKLQSKNPSIHQMNIVVNNDSDESQNKAVQQALEQCPDDYEINHIASNIFQKNMVKGNKYNEEDKNKLNSFNNKLLKSDDEILQNARHYSRRHPHSPRRGYDYGEKRGAL